MTARYDVVYPTIFLVEDSHVVQEAAKPTRLFGSVSRALPHQDASVTICFSLVAVI